MSTAPRVSFGLYGLEIKQDSIPSTAETLQPFSKIADLKTDNATSRPFATFEPDFWLLDGGYKFLPSNTAMVHVGMMSQAMSDANCNFTVPPILTIDFKTAHSMDSLTLRFSQYTGDFAAQINIKYYDATGLLLRNDNYAPTSTEFSTNQSVNNFKKIVLTFKSTNRPYRYLRLCGIDYGRLVNFTGSSIKGADVVEETNMLGASIPIDTLELKLFSADAQFSIINPTGSYTALRQRQPLAVYETIGNQSVFIGQFYLDKWENTSDTEIRFSCIDLLGVLDTMTYRGGIWLGTGISLQTLIEQILEPIYAPYDFDVNLSGVMIKGWIPICTYREALQQIAFAAGAYISCARFGAIKIYKSKIALSSAASNAITKAEKGQDQSLTLKPMVTAVEVTAHNYISSTESKQLFNGNLEAGTHEITFDQPMHDLNISGGTITESWANYAIIQVATAGIVTLNGQIYKDTTQVYTVRNTTLDSTIKPNVLKVEDATLVNSSNLIDVTQRVYDYYQQRYRQKVKLFAPTVEIGDVVTIDTLYNKKIRGVVEKMSIDLSGGFVVQAEITGVEQL